MIAVSHPVSNTFHRALLQKLAADAMLATAFTTIGWSHVPTWLPFCKQLQKRQLPVSSKQLKTFGFLESCRLTQNALQRIRTFPSFITPDHVFVDFDRHVAKKISNQYTGVYAYEDSALATFRRAKQIGIPCFYDLPIGYYAAAEPLFLQRAELYPQFAAAIDGITDSVAKRERKAQEAVMADHIFSCSDFVTNTLLQANIPSHKITTVQFGIPTVIPKVWQPHQGPLKILFAGQIGERKGFGTLLEAVKLLHPHVTLTAVGPMVPNADEVYAPYRDLFTWLPPKTRGEVYQIMQQHDVLVLPSIFEGQALVTLEAMANGLPIIVTPNTGVAQHVTDNGFVIPINDAGALVNALQSLLDDPTQLEIMGASSVAKVQSFTWDSYAEKITQQLYKIV